MAKNNNWVKIHREIFDWEWYKDHKAFKLLLFLILKSNYKAKRWCGIEIERGQLVTSLDHLRSDTGLSLQEVRTNLERFINSNVITKESTNNYTLITLVNYEKYQSTIDIGNTQITDKEHSNNIQLTTTKESKEIKISTTTTKLKTNLDLINSIAKKLNKSTDIIISKIPDFVNYCFDINKQHKDDADLYSHFISWLPKNLKTEVKQNKVDWFIKMFNGVSKRNFKATDEVKKLFAKQLANGFTGRQMKTACKNMYSSDPKNKFHINSGYQHAIPTHLLKDDNVNKYLNQRF